MSFISIGQLPAAMPLDRSAKQRTVYFTAVCASLLLASVIYAPWATTGPVICPFRFATGLPCPGCGLTRSFCAMSRGQIAAAFAYHLFGPILYFFFALALPLMFYQLITARRIEWFHRLCYSVRFARVLAVTFGGYHIVRLIMLARAGEFISSMAHSPLMHLLGHS